MYPKQREYICVYDMKQPQDKFDNHGICVLEPSICEITEELNGTYELYIEHPIDELGKWKALSDHNIIKANGELFRILKSKVKLDKTGKKVQSANCLHIFYDLNHKYLRNISVYDTAHWLLEHIMNNNEAAGDYQIDDTDPDFYKFSYFIDIQATGTAEYRNDSVTAALIGTGSNSLVNMFNAEIYRHNTYFSILPRKEHSRNSAFSIQYGVDMIDIERTVDWTNFCSLLLTDDNFGNRGYAEWGGVPLPHKFTRTVTFNYSEDRGQLGEDTKNYFETINYPKVSYKVNYAELGNSPMYSEFDVLKKCEVGDTGFIYCDDLGIRVDSADPSQQVKVVRKVTDALNGSTVSIELGSLVSSFVRQNSFTNVIAPAAKSTTDGYFKFNKGGTT